MRKRKICSNETLDGESVSVDTKRKSGKGLGTCADRPVIKVQGKDTSNEGQVGTEVTVKKPLPNDAENIARRKKLKRSKRLLREPKIDTKAAAAKEYLDKWKNCRSEWKYQKVLQVFIIKNFLNIDRILDSDFPVVLEYFEKVEGHARKLILEIAEVAVAAARENRRKAKENPESENSLSKREKKVKKRAKKVVALLAE